MAAYLNLNKEPELLKIKTKYDQLEELQYKTEKHDHGNILKSIKIDNDYYKKSTKHFKKSILNYHGNFDRFRIGSKHCYNVINQPQHRDSIDFFNSFINYYSNLDH